MVADVCKVRDTGPRWPNVMSVLIVVQRKIITSATHHYSVILDLMAAWSMILAVFMPRLAI